MRCKHGNIDLTTSGKLRAADPPWPGLGPRSLRKLGEESANEAPGESPRVCELEDTPTCGQRAQREEGSPCCCGQKGHGRGVTLRLEPAVSSRGSGRSRLFWTVAALPVNVGSWSEAGVVAFVGKAWISQPVFTQGQDKTQWELVQPAELPGAARENIHAGKRMQRRHQKALACCLT
ncbi:hypothetical protein TREES_T100014934 [Tupaia chinensis]|uniref:Uncharacterized protein n=1 Tax=Tupaia chinensis TaxID=246437 RepID=L9KNQ8_TUPCH|nr:hypothetical protein TREES_T100014934 [Tupaia chinensis]